MLAFTLGCDSVRQAAAPTAQQKLAHNKWFVAMTQGCEHLDHGRWELAEKHLLQAMKLVKLDEERWETLDRLGSLYLYTNRFEEAERAWTKSLAIVEKIREKDHIDVGTAINNLANFKIATGAVEESEPLFRRAIAIYKKRLGPSDAYTEAAVLNLAISLHWQGKLEEAAPYYEESMRAAKDVHGEDSPNVAPNYFHYGRFKKEQGDLASAERLIEKATKLHAANFGPSHETVANDLGLLIAVQEEREREAEAGQSHLELLKLRRDQSGSNSRDYASQLNTYGEFLDRFEHPAQAQTQYMKALQILVRLYRQVQEPTEPGWLYEHVAWNYGDSLLRSGDNLPRIGEILTELGITKPMVEKVVGYLRENDHAESEVATPLEQAAATGGTTATAEDAGTLEPSSK